MSGGDVQARRDPLAGRHAQARHVFLVDPAPGLRAALAHVLECPNCQKVLRSASRRDAEEAASSRPLLENDGQLLAELWPAAAEKASRVAQARDFLTIVMAAPAEARAALLADDRSTADEFLDVVLKQARIAIPDRALNLAGLAKSLIDRHRAELDEEEAAGLVGEADVIEGSAWLRAGRFDAARAAFDAAAGRISLDLWARFSLCRWEGVLWWELGHFERAESLLRQSMRVLAEEGEPDESAVAQILLGLLLEERGDSGRSSGLLQAGRSSLDREAWPWLATQARMVLAWRVARVGAHNLARDVLQEPLKAEEQSLLDDPCAQRLEGRVRIRLEERKRAEGLFESARIRLLSQKNVAQAALCTLDLALLLFEEGRPEEVEGLLEDIASRFPTEAGVLGSLDETWRVCLEIFGDNRSSFRIPDTACEEFERRLRRALRAAGHRVLLPF